jgi:hypothetical protein
MSERRKGKVAQLPFATRTEVNTWLRDGITYVEICDRLEKAGFPGFSEQNVSNWKEGGHEDWLKEQERLADMAAKREFALEIVKANQGSKIHEASLQLAASQIYDVITDFDPSTLKAALTGDPENYARLVNALSKLSEGGLKYERYRQEVEDRKQKALAEIGRAKSGGITPETLELIEKELKLL